MKANRDKCPFIFSNNKMHSVKQKNEIILSSSNFLRLLMILDLNEQVVSI